VKTAKCRIKNTGGLKVEKADQNKHRHHIAKSCHTIAVIKETQNNEKRNSTNASLEAYPFALLIFSDRFLFVKASLI